MRWYRILTVTLMALGLDVTGSLMPTEASTWAYAGLSQSRANDSRYLAQMANRPTLRLGSVGDAVSELQAMLQLMGYYTGPIDGFYRDATQAGVMQFQAAAGITTDGIVGPSTWEKLFPNPTSVPTASAAPAAAPASAPANPPSSSQATATARPPASSAPASSAQAAPEAASTAAARPPAAIDLPILREGMFGPAVTRLQERLRAMGFYKGELDGIFGPQTVAAVQALQQRNSLTSDGIVGPATWSVLFQ
jgi:peptidoglycan hydrolase-like protein with peptidoglycan-binding domain